MNYRHHGARLLFGRGPPFRVNILLDSLMSLFVNVRYISALLCILVGWISTGNQDIEMERGVIQTIKLTLFTRYPHSFCCKSHKPSKYAHNVCFSINMGSILNMEILTQDQNAHNHFEAFE